MKLKQLVLNNSLKLMVLVALTVLLISSTYASAVASGSYETVIDAPAVYFYADGSFQPDPSSLAAESFNIPRNLDTHSVDFEYRQAITDAALLNQGFRDVFWDMASQAFRVSFSIKIEAPLLDIWTQFLEVESDLGSLDLSDSYGDIQSSTTQTATSDRNMGLSFFYGDESYLLENETDDSGALWEYTTDFSLGASNILYLEDIGNYLTNNLTIVVSYVETTSYVNLNNSYAYNKTILNEPVDGYDDYWFRLDLENTNSSFDAYVANIKLTNFDVQGGRYVLSVDANVTDERYDTMYVGSLDDAEALVADRWAETSTPSQHTQRSSLGLSGFWDNVNTRSILEIGSSLQDKATEVLTEAKGWASADDLERSIKQSIVDRNDDITSIDEVDDLSLTDTIMSWEMTSKARDLIKTKMDQAAELKNTIVDVIDDVKEETVARVQFATDLVASKIEDVKAKAEELKETTLGAFAAAKEKVTTWGANVKSSIVDAAGKIKDGAISAWSGVKQFAEDAVGGFSNLLPWLAAGAVAILVIVLLFRFAPMGK